MRPKMICKGPKLSMAGNQKHNLKKLSIIPTEKNASDKFIGSNVFQ